MQEEMTIVNLGQNIEFKTIHNYIINSTPGKDSHSHRNFFISYNENLSMHTIEKNIVDITNSLAHFRTQFLIMSVAELQEYVEKAIEYDKYVSIISSNQDLYDFILNNEIKDIEHYLKIKDNDTIVKTYFKSLSNNKTFTIKRLKKNIKKYNEEYNNLYNNHMATSYRIYISDKTEVQLFNEIDISILLRKFRTLGIYFSFIIEEELTRELDIQPSNDMTLNFVSFTTKKNREYIGKIWSK
jgi:hypothetical protein